MKFLATTNETLLLTYETHCRISLNYVNQNDGRKAPPGWRHSRKLRHSYLHVIFLKGNRHLLAQY